mgnify:CR=1 FL=1
MKLIENTKLINCNSCIIIGARHLRYLQVTLYVIMLINYISISGHFIPEQKLFRSITNQRYPLDARGVTRAASLRQT